MTKTPATYSAGRADVQVHNLPRYEGTTEIYSPSHTSPGASAYFTLSCGHQHTTVLAAEKCIAAKTARYIAVRNRESAALAVRVPCRYAIHEDDIDGPHWMRVCASHHLVAGTYYPERATAEADEWTCPWQPLAGTASVDLGRDAEGYRVVRNRDGDEVRVSDCCGASAKGCGPYADGEDGYVGCRKCFKPIDGGVALPPRRPYTLEGS